VIKSKKVCQIALIVEDLECVAKRYQDCFGIEPKVFFIPPASAVPTFSDGKLEDCSDVRLAVFELENLVLEVAQPGASDTVFRRWLTKNGPGVHHIGFYVDKADRGEAFASLEQNGAKLAHAGLYPGSTYTFVDGMENFGVDFNIKWNTDNADTIASILANPTADMPQL
jgi:hypothetical protein